MALYNGPIVDAHHHLWRYSPEAFPWLEGDDRLARSFTAADYRAATAGLDVTATVWIEALAADPFAEATGAGAVNAEDPRVCNAIVAHAPVDAPDIADRLDRLTAALPGLRGIRDIVAALAGHSSFARRPDLLRLTAFEAGLRALAERGLSFDLMLEPEQMGAALALARRLPSLLVIIEHAGNPDFASGSGIARWRDAMRAAADAANIAVKISALHGRMPGWTDERLAAPILELVSLFGVDRLAFASDFPTHDAACPSARAFLTFQRAVAGLAAKQQRALFHDTARALYRI